MEGYFATAGRGMAPVFAWTRALCAVICASIPAATPWHAS